MEEDFVSSLTRQVKEEVIENYLYERRILELQIENLQETAGRVRTLATDTGKRITRLSLLAVHSEMRQRLMTILEIPQDPFWTTCFEHRFTRKVRFIRVMGLTGKMRFKRLFLEAYRRLCQWMEKYSKAFDELGAECNAVNTNIKHFHSNFDLLTLLNFVKSLDTSGLERKHFLGENFTPEEMASVDQALYIRPVAMEKLGAPRPLSLPKPEAMENVLSDLASDIYDRYQNQAKQLMST